MAWLYTGYHRHDLRSVPAHLWHQLFLFLSIWTIVSFFDRFTEMTARSATLGMRISGLNFVLYKTGLWTGSMRCFTRWAP